MSLAIAMKSRYHLIVHKLRCFIAHINLEKHEFILTPHNTAIKYCEVFWL